MAPVGALTGAALATACALFQPSGNPNVPAPARTVDIPAYLGRWYEFARYDAGFEPRGVTGVVETYAARPDGLIGIHTDYMDASGRPQVMEGKAHVVPGSGDARLKVSFFGPFYVGDYWVMDHDPAYRWAIVGEPTGEYLWILTRDRHPDPALAARVIGRVRTLGYDAARLHVVG